MFAGGITYGFLHNRTLYKDAQKAHAHAEFKKQEKLIADAKAQWAKLHPKPQNTTGGPVTDLNDPKFDPAAVIDWQIKQLDA